MAKVLGTDGIQRLRPSRLAWLPTPFLLGAIIALWAAHLRGSYESVFLGITLNIVFSMLVSLLVAYLIARSFLVSGAPALLLLGCGVVVWGLAGVVATVVAGDDVNVLVTIRNSCVWLSALCHLAGVSLSLRQKRPLSATALWLPMAYTPAAAAVALVTVSALAGWMPTFFVQGRGGTLLRQVVLSTAIAMFGLTALLLAATRRRPLSAFAYWYALALALLATGLFGVMLQSSAASILGWTGRGTQFLGGLYMLIAAVASVRESHTWGISLEAALRRSEDQLRLALEAAHMATWDWDMGSGNIVWNDERYRILGYKPGAVTPGYHAWAARVHPEDLAAAEARLRRSMEQCTDYTAEYRTRWSDGTVRWAEARGRFEPDATGRAVRSYGVLIDITERKQAEEAVRQSEENAQRRAQELATLMAVTPAAVWISNDPLCRVIVGNRAAQGFYEAAKAENLSAGAIGGEQDFTRRFFQGGRELKPEELPMQVAAAKGIEVRDCELNVLLPSARTITILGNASPLLDADGHVRGSIAAFVDISARKRAEEALRELNATLESKVAQRTAELERRAKQLQKLTLELSQAEDRERKRVAEILHEDLQQQIAGAKFHLSLLNQRTKYDPSAHAIAEKVDEMLKDAIDKSRSLSHELSPAVLHQNDLTEALRWLAQRMQTKHGLAVRVRAPADVTLHSEAMTIFLFRAAQEMLFNAIKHAGVKEARIRIHRYGRWVWMLVSDRGLGFDPEDLREVSGFGLLSIRERVELLGGRMKIRSIRGKGSKVHIIVPDAEVVASSGDAIHDTGRARS